MSDVTRILNALVEGRAYASEELLPLVYDELRRLAAQQLARERPGQTLAPTALVHEAYLRLVANPGRKSGEPQPQWAGRRHFFAAAAEAMRRILIDNARRKGRVKHGANRQRRALDEALPAAMPRDELIALDEALEHFAEREPAKAELVKLRFFAGLTLPEAAEMLGISLATAERHWTYARAWLYAELADESEAPEAKKKRRP